MQGSFFLKNNVQPQNSSSKWRLKILQKFNENLSWWQVIKGVMASMLGVQSDKNRQQDFSQSSFIPFAVVGVGCVLLLILILLLIVNWLLAGLG